MSEHWGGYYPGDGPLRDDIAELTEKIAERDAEIERLRDADVIARTTEANLHSEIERLRAYIAEVEKWKDEGERIIGPAAEWGPSGNVMVQSSTMFKLGAWWADRPWRIREALGE